MSISEISVLQEALNNACQDLGLQQDVKIVAVTNRWRWTLDYEQSPTHPDFARNMLKLETKLQSHFKRPIDLRLEEMKDKMARKKRNVLSDGQKNSANK